jgi:hypothetical protein
MKKLAIILSMLILFCLFVPVNALVKKSGEVVTFYVVCLTNEGVKDDGCTNPQVNITAPNGTIYSASYFNEVSDSLEAGLWKGNWSIISNANNGDYSIYVALANTNGTQSATVLQFQVFNDLWATQGNATTLNNNIVNTNTTLYNAIINTNSTLYNAILNINSSIITEIRNTNTSLQNTMSDINNSIITKISNVNNSLHTDILNINSSLHNDILSINNSIWTKLINISGDLQTINNNLTNIYNEINETNLSIMNKLFLIQDEITSVNNTLKDINQTTMSQLFIIENDIISVNQTIIDLLLNISNISMNITIMQSEILDTMIALWGDKIDRQVVSFGFTGLFGGATDDAQYYCLDDNQTLREKTIITLNISGVIKNYDRIVDKNCTYGCKNNTCVTSPSNMYLFIAIIIICIIIFLGWIAKNYYY